ncbi:PIN domain-containing protein [Brucella pseudogrignonensis]|uniref:PIN-like domain-containing protein n=1 Tax=Brucella pseudogrignonensis TaxID=419475 RepID=UPI001E38C53B|nr:PIN-like domain-containing protein [Brucella pseudogrignonensis]MCD4510971.1 PIN domain-containing protein [Brucella pseudogrignonensis]
MKSLFSGYYAPNQQEFDRLWNEGLIVLDTNVLLDLYRLPATAREELLSAFEVLKDRIWVPYQVALEFQRRRLTVIGGERKLVEDVLSDAKSRFNEVQERIGGLQIEKRGLGIEAASLIEEFKSVNQKLVDALNSVHSAQLDITVADPIRERLDILLAGKVGVAPDSQVALDELCADGDARYENKIPPGYEDSVKDKNPNDATFLHDEICYQRKYGDLILWRQVINHVRESQFKSVILVTSDRKEDWWWREKGKTIGPRPELVREIARLADANLFWMYSSSEFLKNAGNFTQAHVTTQSVDQLDEVSRLNPNISYEWAPSEHFSREHIKRRNDSARSQLNHMRAEKAVGDWILDQYGSHISNRQFPDFRVHSGSSIYGFEVKVCRSLSSFIKSIFFKHSLNKARNSISLGDFDRITIVIVVEGFSNHRGFFGLSESDLAHFKRVSSGTQSVDVMIGYVDEEGVFCICWHGSDFSANSPEEAEEI